MVDAVTAAVAARKKDEKEEAKSKSKGKLKQIKKYSLMMKRFMARNVLFWITFLESDVRKISDVTGRQVESWEVAYFNGAAILDEIPVSNRDQTDQVVFRDRGGGGQSQTQHAQVGCSSEISLEFSHKFY